MFENIGDGFAKKKAPSTHQASKVAGTYGALDENKKPKWQQIRALHSETVAVEHLEKKWNLQLLRSRWKTPFGEVDLILQKAENPRHLIVAEIKTLTDIGHLPTRVKTRQIQRLCRVTSWLSETHAQVELWFVFVLPGDEVLILKSDEMSI